MTSHRSGGARMLATPALRRWNVGAIPSQEAFNTSSQSENHSHSSEMVPSRPNDEWFFVGPASSFPDITNSAEKWFKLIWPQSCANGSEVPGCKVFHPQDGAEAREVPIDSAPGEDAWLMREQVLVFQYQGKFHAVDHACPHRAYSLSWGVPFDIEDAGVVIGAGLRCRGHSFAFDLSTGTGDRGGLRLGIWDIELRPPPHGGEEKEVWVRKGKKSS
ncbi:hypothetical protein GQ53DRAFT_757630 [Thozetella sp. PMI_491]|nr:hypothetical protein GQ53DRAFT_757630 [Thozetella sp. PMI_491]